MAGFLDVPPLDRMTPDRSRVPIKVHPDARKRLNALLMRDGMQGFGYSSFIRRACELAEAELAQRDQFEKRMRRRANRDVSDASEPMYGDPPPAGYGSGL